MTNDAVNVTDDVIKLTVDVINLTDDVLNLTDTSTINATLYLLIQLPPCKWNKLIYKVRNSTSRFFVQYTLIISVVNRLKIIIKWEKPHWNA